jgi:glyoxylase-like metal-dependent hydrolase (beta-lactamase superfamily II)
VKIERIVVGELECNCYLLVKNNSVLVIDPGDEGDKIIEKIGDRNVLGIVITHYHYDHIGALEVLKNKYNVCIYDINNMVEGKFEIGDFVFEVIYTPGHKEDSISLYFALNKCMFSGDFIFRDTIGRWDLPGGDIEEMYESINKIRKYDRDIVVYPGHGDCTSIGYEVDNNIYF